ncbi:hypothetical protein GCM10023310_70350 [Paenibacillus vulneris]|uniref:Transposase n=1 Tax=Paenibacillus vulneris TaxID=1133364 RepID=A0ABW3UIW6_9BACL
MGAARRKRQHIRAVEYAEQCGISYSVAVRRIKLFEVIAQRYRTAIKCPECKKRGLVIDSTDYEYASNEYWVWCSECGYTCEITKKYEPLTAWYGFDIVRAISGERDKEFAEDWETFALKDTIEMEREIYGQI